MLKAKRSRTKTLTQVRAATLADVKRLFAQPRVAASARNKQMPSKYQKAD